MISTSETKTISEPLPYGENSRTHPVTRFVLKYLAYCDRDVFTPTIVLIIVVYAALAMWFCGTVQGQSSLLVPGVAGACALTILIFPFVCLAGLIWLGSNCNRVYHQCYDGATQPLLIETVRIERIERLIPVADLEDFGPGFLGRTQDKEYFFLMSQNLFDLLDSEDDVTTECDDDEYHTEQLPETLELDLKLTSKELIGVRGSGNLVLADELEMVSVCDLPLKEFLDFCVLFKENLSAEVLAKFKTADESIQ